jgi:hypothetical protein
MIELAFFLLVQTVINLLVKRLINTHWQYFFRSLSILFFGVLILIYPFFLVNFYFSIRKSGAIRCGNADIGLVGFLWIIGVPLVVLSQYLLNKYLFMLSNSIKQK